MKLKTAFTVWGVAMLLTFAIPTSLLGQTDDYVQKSDGSGNLEDAQITDDGVKIETLLPLVVEDPDYSTDPAPGLLNIGDGYSDGAASLKLKSGSFITAPLFLSFDRPGQVHFSATDGGYVHRIRTFHSSTANMNMMDFEIWDPTLSSTTLATKNVLRLRGDGTVNINSGNLNVPNNKLFVGTTTSTNVYSRAYLGGGISLYGVSGDGTTHDPLYELSIAMSAPAGQGYIHCAYNGSPRNLIINPNGGRVGIGTTCPPSELSVNGTITAREVIVEATTWCDYVFEPEYNLRSLSEVSAFIALNGHLPEVPSEKEVMENGIKLGEMDAILLKKIEELTLYTIQLQQQIEELKNQTNSTNNDNH